MPKTILSDDLHFETFFLVLLRKVSRPSIMNNGMDENPLMVNIFKFVKKVMSLYFVKVS